jgi:iron(III) transport system permease protein
LGNNFQIKLKSSSKLWLTLSIVFSIVLLIPLGSIFLSLFETVGDGWNELFNGLIQTYLLNTLILAVGVSFFTLLFAVLPAWLIANYRFPFSKSLKWMMVLPLSIPTYIIAFIYGDIFSFGGEFYLLADYLFGFGIKEIYFDIFKVYYLIPILSSVLYPYIYLTCLDSFENNNRAFIESAELLGKSRSSIFRKIALPLSRPAIVSGLFLVNMELLNDYGAMDFFGIQTFTTGIFRTWFGMNDLGTALRLALILFTISFLFIYAERLFRRQAKYYEEGNHTNLTKKKKGSIGSLVAMIICFIPVILGFVIPIAKLIYNAFTTYHSVDFFAYTVAMMNTTFLAFAAASVIVIISLALIYGERTGKFGLVNKLISLSTVGYAIPGAIIAVSMLFFLSGLKSTFGVFGFGTLIVLIYAYNIRFMATAYTPIKSATDKLGMNSYDTSRLLGFGNLRTFWKVELPIIQPAILTAMLVAVVEILKELPLTLILRPFNYETLSTIAYQYAKNEMVKDASIYSLSIVAISILPIIFFVKSKKEQ